MGSEMCIRDRITPFRYTVLDWEQARRIPAISYLTWIPSSTTWYRSHSRTLTSGKLDSTPNARCPASPPRRSGESLPGADCLQSVSGNSRVLDTLDTKLRVEAYYVLPVGQFAAGCRAARERGVAFSTT